MSIFTKTFEITKIKKNKLYAWNSTIPIRAKKRSVKPLKQAKNKIFKASKKKSKLPKKITLAKRKEALWELCKEYTKKRDGILCVSCKKRTGTQCGHFLPSSACNLVYKFYENNIGRQCSYCNLYLKGNYVSYRKHQIEKYGEDIVKIMELEYCSSLGLSFNPREFVEKKIEWYTNQLKKYSSKFNGWTVK
jgi:hypothetical protein